MVWWFLWFSFGDLKKRTGGLIRGPKPIFRGSVLRTQPAMPLFALRFFKCKKANRKNLFLGGSPTQQIHRHVCLGTLGPGAWSETLQDVHRFCLQIGETAPRMYLVVLWTCQTKNCLSYLGPPTSALLAFFGEGSPTKIDYRRKSGTLILTSLLEDLVTERKRQLESQMSLLRPAACALLKRPIRTPLRVSVTLKILSVRWVPHKTWQSPGNWAVGSRISLLNVASKRIDILIFWLSRVGLT